MDLTFSLILLFIAGLAVIEHLASPEEHDSTHKILRKSIERARRQGTLGPPRLTEHLGQLCVVGYGQRYPVKSKIQGRQVIAKLAQDAEQILNALSPDKSGKHPSFSGKPTETTPSSASRRSLQVRAANVQRLMRTSSSRR